MAGTQCGECKKSFSKIGNLRAHVKRAHPDKLNVLAPKKTYAPVATCIECNNTFVNTSNLNAHIRTKHPDLIKNKAQCEICKSENKKSSAFCKHVKNHKNARRMNCSLCRVFSDSSKANLLEHYKQAHEIKLEYEEVAFSSFNEFLLWKQRIEKDTQASFVTMHGSSKTKSHTLIRKWYSTENDLFIDTDHIETEVPVDALIEPPTKTASVESTENTFLERKKQVLAEVLDICESVSTPEELEVIEKCLESIRKSIQDLRPQNS
ncbi:hypothetical protein Zmor_004973 [Zophobas morio]|uniref:C2H2-type domain-containing protein n=1 Tax=Zophobas morio TaxID=2755281 RepID=A0AA38MK32_9CUCU|nr:hypothetical protein Zmor_004973 [Zophobas morio]